MKKSVVILLILFTSTLHAQTNIALMQQGIQAYKAHQYEKAIQSWGKIQASGMESPALYYNLGNAYYKLNRLPEAILNYEKTLRMEPGNSDARFNLKIANSKIIDKIDVLPVLFYKAWWNDLRSFFSVDSWAWISLTSLFVFLLLLAGYLLLRSRSARKFSFFAALIFLLVFAFSFILAFEQKNLYTKDKEAIIFEPAVAVKSSPDEASIDLFMLHEGTKVRLLDHVGAWSKISLANGSIGWLPDASFKPI